MKETESNPIIDGLLKRRTVVLEGEINSEKTMEVAQKLILLQMESSESINLIIDSGGGNTDAALKLCDIMDKLITAPIHGITIGRCGSAATFVMLHCNKRMGTPYSRFLIHSGTIGKISLQINDTTSENLEHLLKEAQAVKESVIRLYMNRLTPKSWAKKKPTETKKREFVKNLINRGDQQFNDWLSTEEAVSLGLIEEVVANKLDIFS